MDRGVGNLNKSDLHKIYHIVQSNMTSYPKELIIATLRDFFSKDSYYHYVKDEFGFPKTPDHTDLNPKAGLKDDLTTRIYIGEKNRTDGIYYPAILVSFGGARSVPISINREAETVQYEFVDVVDNEGNIVKQFRTPRAYIFAGAFEGSINIDVMGRGIKERDDILELVAMLFVDIRFNELSKNGISIKPGSPSINSPSEETDRGDKLYKQSITLEFRSEWRREIPVRNYIDAINFCIEFGSSITKGTSPNIRINTYVDLLNSLQDL